MNDRAPYSIEVLRDAGTIDTLAPAWSALPQARSRPMLSHDWVTSAGQAFHDGAQRTVVVRSGAEMVAGAPLAAVRRGSVEWFEIVGSTALYEPGGFLFRDDASLQALCRALIASGHPIQLPRISADDPLLPAFTAAARGRGKLFTLNASGYPYVTIATSWQEYAESLSSRRRQDYRRARRRLEKEGKVELDIRQSTEASIGAELAEAMQVEATGWKQQGGTSLLQNERMRQFFQSLTLRLARQGLLRMCFLRLDGRAIAMQLCVEYDRRLWVLKIGFDERWAALSPGVQLMWDVLQYAFERGLHSFELLGTAESWLKIWTESERPCRTLVYYPWNARGVVALSADIMRTFRRRMSGSGERAEPVRA